MNTDLVDKDGDGQVNHYEFVTVLTAGSIGSIFELNLKLLNLLCC